MKARRAITRKVKESDSSPNFNVGTPSGSSSNGKTEDKHKKTVQPLSLPGALQCIQHEWNKVEIERSQWAANRAELEAKVAFLQGQKKGQDRLVYDLVCRIKMLEYSLKEERAKYHKLQHGTDLQQGDNQPEEPEDAPQEEEDFLPPRDWRQGRELIRQYLSEIGYTEAVMNVNSYRVQRLLRLYDNAQNKNNVAAHMLGGSTSRSSESSIKPLEKQTNGKKTGQPCTVPESILLESEAEIMAKYSFLQQDEDTDDEREDEEKGRGSSSQAAGYDRIDGDLKSPTKSEGDSQPTSVANWNEAWPTDDSLGDLVYLTPDCLSPLESNYLSWGPQYVLRGHLDGIRSLAFHPVDPLLATASEDRTVCLWDLQAEETTAARADLAPAHTYREHVGPVICVAISPTGTCVVSGGLDGSLVGRELPDMKQLREGNVSDLTMRLEGHSDAVWGLSYQLNSGRTTLLSCSSDGSVKLWAPEETPMSLKSFRSQDGECPTSVDFVRSIPNHMVTSYDTGECIVYELEYGKPVVWMETPKGLGPACRINRVVSHPSEPLVVTAWEDGCIRFFDIGNGTLMQTLVGHHDSVTSIAIDHYGMYMLTASHDRTVCMWDVRTKKRIQQIFAHGRKFEESIFDVAFHKTRPLIASAGADGCVQVFRPT